MVKKHYDRCYRSHSINFITMNVIFTFKTTEPFTEAENKELEKAFYSQIPEMRIIDGNVPYQATINEFDFDSLLALLSSKGTVTIIGKWNDDGILIIYDVNLYRSYLNDIVTYETALFLDGADYTGKEETFVKQSVLDENGNNIILEPSRNTFVREKSRKRPTLSESKLTQVNNLTGTNPRQL